MSTTLRVALFTLAELIVLYGMSRYVWARVVRDTRLPAPWRKVATITILCFGVLLPIGYRWAKATHTLTSITVAWVAFTWLGWLFYVVLCLALLEAPRWLGAAVGRLRRRSRRRPDEPALEQASALEQGPALAQESALARTPAAAASVDLGRRVFIARSLAGGALLGASGVAYAGYRSAAGELLTPEIPVRLGRLPPALSGFRIVQLSDLHVGPILGGGFLTAIVDQANALRPDLIVITGDLVDASVEALGRELAPLQRLRARHGVVFVTGNHEYYSDGAEWIEFLRARGMRVLINERMSIGDAGPGGASFDLAGVPDLRSGGYIASHRPDLARALDGRDDARELVLLAHQPVQIFSTRGAGVGLQLSGHTHGGQMWPFGELVRLEQPYIHGLHRHDERTQIYVSRGAGYWGPPMRVGNPAEIACIVLT